MSGIESGRRNFRSTTCMTTYTVENLYPNENRLLMPDNSRFRKIGVASRSTNEGLQPSPIMVAVIISITYNHMVEEVDSHKVASLFEGLCQCVVKFARMDISARVVVDEGKTVNGE